MTQENGGEHLGQEEPGAEMAGGLLPGEWEALRKRRIIYLILFVCAIVVAGAGNVMVQFKDNLGLMAGGLLLSALGFMIYLAFLVLFILTAVGLKFSSGRIVLYCILFLVPCVGLITLAIVDHRMADMIGNRQLKL